LEPKKRRPDWSERSDFNRRKFKKPSPPKDSRTKFDRWLDGAVQSQRTVYLTVKEKVFEASAFPVQVKTVDRYWIEVIIYADDEVINPSSAWISKENILSASFEEDMP